MKEPELVELEEFLVMGLEITTSEAREASPVTAVLPALWRTFFTEKLEDKIAHRKNPNEHVGVYSDYDRDAKSRTFGSYAALAGCEVTELIDDVPEGLVAIAVPAGSYLLFEARGPMPEAVIRTWEEIRKFFENNRQYERAYDVDFDLYRNDQPESVDIFVGVK